MMMKRAIPVLYVADDLRACEGFDHFLQKSGEISIDFAFSTEEALDLLYKNEYHVVVWEYHLKGTDGLSFPDILRSQGKQIPFIIVGDDTEGVVIEAINRGTDSFLNRGKNRFKFYIELSLTIKKAARKYAASARQQQEEGQQRSHAAVVRSPKRRPDEKDILIQEVHHRVKNNLQLISSILRMHSYRTADPETKEILEDCINRIASMALIHEYLYRSDDLVTIRMAEYVPSIVRSLSAQKPCGMERVEIIARCDPKICLDVDTCIPCGIIINELITNALKYGFVQGESGEIVVSMDYCRRGLIRLVVSDSGSATKSGVDLESDETLGMQLVKNLITQIDGTLTVSEEGGLTFSIVFPYTE
ncbi:histidine kinase dimerization/phosphoacceptor domain -containing protein [Methanogenium sp. MK-MG]|uniref:histidine kinase dimerization/phosphoacceptor domain -containing protein n=1 Tax=Methanogenium sp. MK-MG TaxID=2599926 RepID=UPI0013EDF9DC|nr:histidine kinase dimerization/phosphoacceptor domain -containing protein [Methanogenium sp. MK-MG]